MFGLTGLLAAIAITGFMRLPYTAANADSSTGHVRNAKPTDSWLAKNKALRITPEIQVSECAMNTRLHFPNVQLFAWFRVNHTEDHYHGCPYGSCLAFTEFPAPDDLEIDFTFSHVFFWHDVAGIPGTGVKAISNPQTGAFGYELSISGAYHDGPTPAGTIQKYHDENYPGFHPEQLVPWPKGAAERFLWAPEPKHIKCGLPCEPNKDPGINPGAYGSQMYSPAPAGQYPPPPGWKPTARDQCPGPTPSPDPCASFCSCASQCKDDKCISKCRSSFKGATCDPSKCPTTPAPSPPPPAPLPNPPQPGPDPDKCLNFCSCLDFCQADKKCINSKCRHIKHGCKKARCTATPSSSHPNPPPTDPKSSSPRPSGRGNGGKLSTDPVKNKDDSNDSSSSSSHDGSGGKCSGASCKTSKQASRKACP